MEELIAQIKQALEQGADPQQLIGQLLQQYSPEQVMEIFQTMGAPAEQVQGMIQQAMQQGQGQQPQGGGEQDQVQQIVMMYAEMSGQDPQAIVQQLQQASPEEQQQAIQQMAMAVQQAQQGQQAPQAKKGMEMPDNAGWNALPENAKEAIIENITKKMFNGGVTKKDFKAIAKEMVKEYKAGGETSADTFDSSSLESFNANLTGAIMNWFNVNSKIGGIKKNAKRIMETFADLVEAEKKNLDQAKIGKELPKADPGMQTGAVTTEDLSDDDSNGDGEKKYTTAELQDLINKGEVRWDAENKKFINVDPAKVNTVGSNRAVGKIFEFSKTPTIKAAGDAPLSQELEAFKNFDPETQQIQRTQFATNIFGKKLDQDKSDEKLEKWYGKGKWDKINRRSGVNLQVVGKEDSNATEDVVSTDNESEIPMADESLTRGEKRRQKFEDSWNKKIAKKESRFRPGLRNRLFGYENDKFRETRKAFGMPNKNYDNTGYLLRGLKAKTAWEDKNRMEDKMEQGGELNYNDKLIWDFKNHCYIENPTLPKAEGGIDVGSKNKLNINWANLADRTIAGMNEANTILEQMRTYDPKRALAARQNFAQVVEGGDSGLFADILRGKAMPDDMGARAGTGSDPLAFATESNYYMSGDLNTGDQWRFKEGGTVESDEDFVKRMQGLGMKIKLK